MMLLSICTLLKGFLKRLKNVSDNVFSAKSLAYYFCTYERWWNGKKWKDFRKVFELLYFKLYPSIRVGVRRSNFMRSKFNFFMRSNLFNNNLTIRPNFAKSFDLLFRSREIRPHDHFPSIYIEVLQIVCQFSNNAMYFIKLTYLTRWLGLS